jgi:hypothetical protein
MTTLREAAQQALEALEVFATCFSDGNEAITALRAALAQEEQEPYCYIYEYDSAFGLHRQCYPGPYNGKQKPDRDVPVYTNPPRREWQGLTEEEREQATGWSVEHIEAKLKEKNA